MRMKPVVIGVSLLCAGVTFAQPYDFSQVTRLAQGALLGQHVTNPVPGFELLIMHEGRVVYHRAFGAWSLGRVAACDSATKTISGAVIMSLTERSAVPFSLQSRLREFIPEFSGDKSTITVSQAFSHTSGLGNSTVMGNPFITLQQAALRIADDPLLHAPGSTFFYAGTSMHAAGAAAEIAAAMSWNDLFRERLADPLGLSLTTFALTTPANPRIAGGCESTAEEFARFMEMLRRRGLHGQTRILAEASVDAMLTRQPPPGIPVAHSPLGGSSDYGVGIWLDQRDGHGELIGALAAGARGFSSWLDLDDHMVGVFATDLTIASNIEELIYLIRAAAEDAIRGCYADCDPAPPGILNIFDFLCFGNAFVRGDPYACDCDLSTGPATCDIFDFLCFGNAFSAGCP